MATARYKPLEEREIVLTLSEDEGEFLYSMMRRVGGDPKNSPRSYADSIKNALEQLGLESKYTPRGSIYF